MRTISIQVPEDASEGDVLTFQLHGQELDIPVPSGSVPGDALSIQVSSGDEPGHVHDETTEDVTSIDLGAGRGVLQLHSVLPADWRKKLENQSTTGCGERLCDVTDDSDGTHAMPWSAGLLLAQRIASGLSKDFPWVTTLRTLELGSGLGLVGMTFAATLRAKLREHTADTGCETNNKREVVLTDLMPALPLLEYNLECNQELLPSMNHAKALEWTIDGNMDADISSGADDAANRPFECILGSDLLYNASAIPALVATIRRLVHPTRGRVVLGVRWRKPELERDFFVETSKFLDWKLLLGENSLSDSLPGGAYCNLSWMEFGDPKCESSNLYFSQTLISVPVEDGTSSHPTPLSKISEAQLNRLSTEEYEAWDRAYVQVYIGTAKSST